MAKLPRAGREYFHWPILAGPAGASFEAFVNGGWVTAQSDGTNVSLLIEGPDVAPADHDASAVVLTDDEYIRFRVKDSPEIVIRGGDWITLD